MSNARDENLSSAVSWAIERGAFEDFKVESIETILLVHPPAQSKIDFIPTENKLILSPFASEIVQESPSVQRITTWPEQLAGRYGIFVFFGENKEEARSILSSIASMENKPIFVIGVASNDLGSSHILKIFSEYFDHPKSISKHHCRVFLGESISEPLDQSLLFSRYGAPEKIELHDLFTAPGIFSRSAPDIGSQLFVNAIDDLPTGPGLDIGAGYGYLVWGLLKKGVSISDVTLVEHDIRALECAKLNLSSFSQTTKLNYIWEDLNKLKMDSSFSWCLLNPPFHFRGDEDRELGISAFRAAHRSLKVGGKLFVVYNSHLPYSPIINELFDINRTLIKERGFIVQALTKRSKYRLQEREY